MRVEDVVLEEARLAVGPLVSGGKARKQRELYQHKEHRARYCAVRKRLASRLDESEPVGKEIGRAHV